MRCALSCPKTDRVVSRQSETSRRNLKRRNMGTRENQFEPRSETATSSRNCTCTGILGRCESAHRWLRGGIIVGDRKKKAQGNYRRTTTGPKLSVGAGKSVCDLGLSSDHGGTRRRCGEFFVFGQTQNTSTLSILVRGGQLPRSEVKLWRAQSKHIHSSAQVSSLYVKTKQTDKKQAPQHPVGKHVQISLPQHGSASAKALYVRAQPRLQSVQEICLVLLELSLDRAHLGMVERSLK